MSSTVFKQWLKVNGMALPELFVYDTPAYTFDPQNVTLSPELLHQLDRVRLLQNAADGDDCPDRDALDREIEQAHRFVSWMLQSIVYPESN